MPERDLEIIPSFCLFVSFYVILYFLNFSETISYLGSKTRHLVPQNNKDSENVNNVKSKTKLLKPESCSCRSCKIYLPQIGFI